MLARRQVFRAAGASVALSSFLLNHVADAASPAALPDFEPRGHDGRMRRLASLDLESQQDFTLGFRLMQAKQIRAAANETFDRVLAKHGIDPATPMTMEEVVKLTEAEPSINIAPKTWLVNQQITWKTLQDYFHANADFYMSEMEANDKKGPGVLELNPTMDIPAYARHEIHIQPGGYVGDEFAGYIYQYGTNSFYIAVLGHNEQDQIHKATAARFPIPEDGKVRRILDMGCGIGQMTMAMKERFPEAEVWGIDVGGPMVRYAHMKANSINVNANFAQRLAEDTKFPDNHFDIVVSYIMHHEVPQEITRKIIAEAHRITRPGGVYYPVDFNTGGLKAPARGMYGRWWDHRWNNEVWSQEYHTIDFSGEIAKHFTMPANAKAAVPGFGIRHAIKT